MKRFLKITKKAKIIFAGVIVLIILGTVFGCIDVSDHHHHDSGHTQTVACHTFTSYTSINHFGNRTGILLAASLLLLFGLLELYVSFPLRVKRICLPLSSRFIYFVRRFIPPPTSPLFYAFKKGVIHTQVYSITR